MTPDVFVGVVRRKGEKDPPRGNEQDRELLNSNCASLANKVYTYHLTPFPTRGSDDCWSAFSLNLARFPWVSEALFGRDGLRVRLNSMGLASRRPGSRLRATSRYILTGLKEERNDGRCRQGLHGLHDPPPGDIE